EGVICFEEQDCHGGHVETGSHNLVVGIGQSYTSYAGIIGGRHNTASDPNSFVVGRLNQTSGFDCVCAAASVSGGEQNTSSGWGTVSGGTGNTAREDGLVSGGAGNLATFDGSVLGGQDNMASATEGSSVSGGYKNIAEGRFSLVFGGKEVIAKAGYEACGGY